MLSTERGIDSVQAVAPSSGGTGDLRHKAIIEQTRLGRSPAQIVEDYDGVLTLSQVYDALSYFYEHQGEIE